MSNHQPVEFSWSSFPTFPLHTHWQEPKGCHPDERKQSSATALWNRFFLSHRHSFMARSCKTAKCSMNTLGPVPCRWLCPSTWPEIQGEGKKTTLQFLSKRWPDGSKSKAHSLLLTTKRNWKQPCGQHSHTGVGQDLRGQNKMLLGSIPGPNRLKRPDWQRTWFELLWHRETCSYLARAPPAGRRAELRLLGQLQTTCRSLWRRPGRGKELRQSKSLVRLTKGAKGPVIAQSVPKATIFVQSRFRAVR